MSKLIVVQLIALCVLLSGDFNGKQSVYAGSHDDHEDHEHEHEHEHEEDNVCGLPNAYTEVRAALNITGEHDIEEHDVEELVHHVGEMLHCHDNTTCRKVGIDSSWLASIKK